MHFHLNERLDGDNPVAIGTARDRDSLADAVRQIVPAFALHGWGLTKWEISGWQNTQIEFATEHDNHTHLISMAIWGCHCESGEHELRQLERKTLAWLN